MSTPRGASYWGLTEKDLVRIHQEHSYGGLPLNKLATSLRRLARFKQHERAIPFTWKQVLLEWRAMGLPVYPRYGKGRQRERWWEWLGAIRRLSKETNIVPQDVMWLVLQAAKGMDLRQFFQPDMRRASEAQLPPLMRKKLRYGREIDAAKEAFGIDPGEHLTRGAHPRPAPDDTHLGE